MHRQELSIVKYLDKEYKKYTALPSSSFDNLAPSDEGDLFVSTNDLIQTHYDEDIEFFKCFLDPSYMTYTMAYYGDSDVNSLSIEDAQVNKFELIIERAEITDGAKILNIGCGFASFDRYLISKYPNVEVVGVTPSNVQSEYINGCIRDDAAFAKQFTLHKTVFDYDYVKALSKEDIKFDVIISIGVLEQLNNIKEFLRLSSGLLKHEGVSFHHFITSSIPTPQVQLDSKAIIGKYFPGGRVWPHAEFVKYQDDMVLDKAWQINGMNYHKTLTAWHDRFWCALPDLIEKGFSLDQAKHWNDYFMLCRCLFASQNGGFYQVSHYLHRRS